MNQGRTTGESRAMWLLGLAAVAVILVMVAVFGPLLGGLVSAPTTSTSLATAPTAVAETPISNEPPERQTVEAIIRQTRFAVTIPPQTGTPFYNPPSPIPVTPEPWDWGSGIVHSGDAPFSAMDVSISNRWYGMLDEQRVLVYAGGLKDNPGVSADVSKGLIVVIVASPEQEYPPQFYTPPTNTGQLTITSEDNLRLVLSRPNGEVSYFDIPSRQFVDSLTATPPPTVTRMPTSTAELPTQIQPGTAYPAP